MSEAVGIKEQLRRLRAPRATGPEEARTLTMPKTALQVLDNGGRNQHQTDHQSRPNVLFGLHGGPGDRRLANRIEAVSEAALATSKHGRVAQGEATCLGFAQLLKQVKEISRLIGFKHYHKLLVVEAE